MKYPEYFRKLAKRCRILSKTAGDPELVDQMRLWAVDFADEADREERRAVQGEWAGQRLLWYSRLRVGRLIEKAATGAHEAVSRALQDRRVTTRSKRAR